MKKTFIALVSLILTAQFVKAEPGMIAKKDGKKINCEILNVDAVGTIEYEENKFKSKAKPGDYLYAKVSKVPTDYANAEKLAKAGNYQNAVSALDAVYASKYRFLGYELPCLYWKAFCLEKLGKDADAVKILKDIQSAGQPADKTLDSLYYDSKKLLASIYVKQNKYDDAYPILTELGNSSNDSLAAYSFNMRGEILNKQGKKKEAVLKYMITALLFPKNVPERADSLVNIVAILKEQNDNRAIKFEEMLKADYPDKVK